MLLPLLASAALGVTREEARHALQGEEVATVVPDRLPWVFAVSGHSSHANDGLVRVAVSSALANTTLRPICLHAGERNNSLHAWLESRVEIVHHTPEWLPSLLEAAERARSRGEADTLTPLFSDDAALLGTLLRVDVPLMEVLDGSPYVLYTDADVVFLSDISLEDFTSGGKHALPEYFTMGAEVVGGQTTQRQTDDDDEPSSVVDYGNAGVMLMNLPNMRASHAGFVSWLFNESNVERGLNFGIYGPADQGALNEYYQGNFSVVAWPLFNWKPYWGYTTNASLIHFHGPKPDDYYAFHQNGTVQYEYLRPLLERCEWPSSNSPLIDRERIASLREVEVDRLVKHALAAEHIMQHQNLSYEELGGRGCFAYHAAWQMACSRINCRADSP